MKLDRTHVLTTPCSLNFDRTIATSADRDDGLHAVRYYSGRIVGVVEDSGHPGSDRWIFMPVVAGIVKSISSIWGPSRRACLLTAERQGFI